MDEMQLRNASTSLVASTIDSGETNSAFFDEYNARRCAVCGAKFPPFGFGTPLKPGDMIWACSADRAQVEQQLRPSPPPSGTPAERLL